MNKKSFFSQIMLLVILSIVCIVATIAITLWAGSYNTTIFDFKNLNFSNMIPVLVVGGFLSCVIVGITVLFVSRAMFHKVKDYFLENNEDGGKE